RLPDQEFCIASKTGKTFLLLGFVIFALSSILDVSLDPTLKGFNFPSVQDTNKKNFGHRRLPLAVIEEEEDELPWFLYTSDSYVFIFISLVCKASFCLSRDASACIWILVDAAASAAL
ncbi:hypothetical protein U1Q18_042512, partial [Sarracenia purpurea var. burkii]